MLLLKVVFELYAGSNFTMFNMQELSYNEQNLTRTKAMSLEVFGYIKYEKIKIAVNCTKNYFFQTKEKSRNKLVKLNPPKINFKSKEYI